MSGKNRLFKSGKTIRLRWDFCRSRISAGFGKSAGFQPEPEPKSGTALVQAQDYEFQEQDSKSKNQKHNFITDCLGEKNHYSCKTVMCSHENDDLLIKT